MPVREDTHQGRLFFQKVFVLSFYVNVNLAFFLLVCICHLNALVRVFTHRKKKKIFFNKNNFKKVKVGPAQVQKFLHVLKPLHHHFVQRNKPASLHTGML